MLPGRGVLICAGLGCLLGGSEGKYAPLPPDPTALLGLAMILSPAIRFSQTLTFCVFLLLAACTRDTFEGSHNVDPGTSEVVLGSTTMVANFAPGHLVQIQLRNERGLALAGKAVVLSLTGAGNTITQPVGVTNRNGMAVGRLASSLAESKLLTVTADGVVITNALPVEFIGDANHLSPLLSTAQLGLFGPFVADGVERAQINVVVRDVFGNPVPGQVVEVGSTGTDNNWVPPVTPTPSNGQVVAELYTTVAEDKAIFVRINPGPDQFLLNQPPTAVFIGDATQLDAGLSTLQATPAGGIVADGINQTVLTGTARDLNGNLVPNVTMAFFATGTGNVVVDPVTHSDANGRASGTLTSTMAEMKLASVVFFPGPGQVLVAQSAPVVFIPDGEAISAGLSSVSINPAGPLVADGVQLGTISVVVRDAFGNPVEGQSVQLLVDGGGNTLIQPMAVTDAAGAASGTLASIQAGSKLISVIINPGPLQVALSSTPAWVFEGDASNLSAGLSSFTATPATGLIADGADQSTLTATVRDVNGNIVAGQTVQLLSTGGNNNLVQPAAATDLLGQAAGTLDTTQAQLKTVSAIINPGAGQVAIAQTATVDFTGDSSAIDIAASTLVIVPNTNVIANGVQTCTVTLSLVDGHGNAVPATNVIFAATGSGNTWGLSSGVTDLAGQFSGTLDSTVAETKTLSATVDPGSGPLVLTAAPTVVFVADSANPSILLSRAVCSPATGVPADGATSSLLTVTVRDPMGNAIAGVAVQFACTGSGNALTQPAANTNAAGQTTGSLASTKAELKQLTITLDPAGTPVVLLQSPTVAFVGDASQISTSLSSAYLTPADGVLADGLESATLNVFVRDINGNGVAGQAVQFVATGSNNTLTQPAGVSDAEGHITGGLLSTTAESKDVTVTVDPAGTPLVLAQVPSVVFVGDASSLSAGLSSVTANPGSNVPADGNSSTIISVVLRDANSNALPGLAIAIASTGTGNTFVGPVGTTDAAGTITVQMQSTVSEVKTLTITGDPSGGNVALTDQPSVTFVPPSSIIAAGLSSVQLSETSGLRADGLQVCTVSIVVRDLSGNAVPGQNVSFTASGPGNTLTQPAGVTDGTGSISGSFVSTSMGSKTVSVTVNAGANSVALDSSPAVEFGYALSNTYYVRATGTDPGGCSDGTSPATAWLTLSQAAGCVSAGDTVYVGAGTHVGPLIMTTSGSVGSPIRFIADTSGAFTGDAGAVNIDGAGANESVYLDGAAHVHVLGFTITGAADLGSGTGGIRVEGDFAVLRDNRLIDNSAGIFVAADDVWIEGNSISNSAGSVPHGLTIVGSARCTALNNLIYNNAGHGLSISGTSVTASVLSNTVYLNGLDGLWVDSDSNAVVATDNLFVDNADDGLELLGGSTLTTSYNDVVGNGDQAYVGLVAGTGDLSTDPAFEDPAGLDGLLGGANALDDSFELDPGVPSVAIDAGSMLATGQGLHAGTLLADRSTRVDGLLDGQGADGTTVNMGFHGFAAEDPLPVLAMDDGHILYGDAGDRQVTARAWDASGAALAAAKRLPPTGDTVRWVRSAISPAGTHEVLVMALSDDGAATRLEMLRWTGTSWVRDWTQTGMASSDSGHRAFDLTYESTSGQVLAVYSDGSATPAYRTYSAGEWSNEASLPINDAGGPNPDPNAGVVFWVELESDPNSDSVALAYVDQAQTLVAMRWDGSAWVTASVSALEAAVTALASGEVDNRAFDLAWEGSSGDLLVAWGREASASFFWSTLASGSNTWGAAAQVPATIASEAQFLDLSAQDGSDLVACGFVFTGPGTETLGLAMWDGSAWVNAGQYDGQALDAEGASPGDFPLALGWSGATESAICVYADDQAAALNWMSWTSSNGWEVRGDIAWAGMGLTQSVQLSGTSEGLMLLVSDAADGLFLATHGLAGWTLQDGASAIGGTLSDGLTVPFSLHVGR